MADRTSSTSLWKCMYRFRCPHDRLCDGRRISSDSWFFSLPLVSPWCPVSIISGCTWWNRHLTRFELKGSKSSARCILACRLYAHFCALSSCKSSWRHRFPYPEHSNTGHHQCQNHRSYSHQCMYHQCLDSYQCSIRFGSHRDCFRLDGLRSRHELLLLCRLCCFRISRLGCCLGCSCFECLDWCN